MIFSAYADRQQSAAGVKLVSCGHIFAREGRRVHRPQGRQDWLLFYVANGREKFFLTEETVAEAGAFVLYAPGEKQHHICLSENAEFYYVHFQCDSLPEDLTLETSRVFALPFRRQICDAFEEIIDETLQKQPCYEQLCIYRLLGLMTSLQRETIRADQAPGESFRRIARAVQHMSRYYAQDLTLSDYAAMCGMSKYHFLRLFRQATGCTPLRYRARIRLEQAAELLLQEQMSVEQISAAVGFATAAYFSSAFKGEYGVSPQQYRRIHTAGH